MGRLAGKVAIVTGIGHGIGQGCALRFAREGALVVGCDIDAAAAAQTEAVVLGEGLPFLSVAPVDLTQPEGAERVVDAAIAAHGRLDIVVNAAAFCVFDFVPDMSFENWRRTLSGELDIVFLMCRAAWPHLIAAGGGAIVNFSSVNAYAAHPVQGAIAHCAGKGGVLAMTRQLAMEGGKSNIRANTIAPGMIETGATGELLKDPEFVNAILAEKMIKRIGTPADIAACTVFLCSDEASWITAADFSVDGGTLGR